MIKISIIVPIYNVENYIRRCLDSLIHQTMGEIEIILVDDGSPDNCPIICDEYAKQDSRIRVLHKRNGGLSDSRNQGMKMANGDYIIFVDADDYITSDACEKLHSFTKETIDIVAGGSIRVQGNQTIQMKRKEKYPGYITNGREYLKIELKNGTMFMPVWMNLYRREFLLDNNLFFTTGLLHEDEQWTPRVFLKAGQVIDSQYCFYYYIIREGSITTQTNKIKNAEHLLNTCKELERIYSEIEDDELKKLLDDNLLGKFLNIFQVAGLNENKYSYLIDKEFIKGKAYTIKNKLRVMLFLMDKNLYFHVNKVSKDIRRMFSKVSYKSLSMTRKLAK